MICEKCGAQLPENAKFCLECGNPVTIKEEPEEVKSVFDDLQVEEVDSDSFFGQLASSPVEEINPPKIEESPNIIENVEDVPLQEEVVSDPFGFTPEAPSAQPAEPVVDTLPTPDANGEIPINIPNPIPETPVSAAMPDLDLADDTPSVEEPITTTVMNSGTVNQTTMSGITDSIIENNPIPEANPNPNILQMASNIEKTPDSVDDLLTDSAMNPPPLNKSDNSFAQPNFDQYSVNMMYGSNTEEEQYLRMQKEQLQPAKSFEKGTSPLPGAGGNVVSDFGNTYGNGLNKNNNINAYQNNMQRNPQMGPQPMQRPQVNAFAGPKNPQPTTFGSQLNQNPQMQQQAPQQNVASNVKDPSKKKSPAGKIIVFLLILVILGALGYMFYPTIMDFINEKKNPTSNTAASTGNTVSRVSQASNVITIDNTIDNTTGNEVDVDQLLENVLGTNNTVENNTTTGNVINLDAGNNSTANIIALNETNS